MAGAELFSEEATMIFIPVCAVIGIVFALFQWLLVSRVNLNPDPSSSSSSSSSSVKNGLIEEEEGINDHAVVSKCSEIQAAISQGATSFLYTEYKYMGAFMVVFAVVIFLFLGSVDGFSTKSRKCTYDPYNTCKPALATAAFTTIAFLLGAFTSVLSGFLGMKIATYANARTTLEARKGVGKAFITAFRSGAVMGFLLAASGLLVLYLSVNLFRSYYGDDWEGLFESITGYGLGGSSMALFGRVGGGIYTKAADVGADLVGKVERNIPEDDPRNPAVIADNVGDNVGDIAGMGSDLFGSYAESSCAALVVASISSFGIEHDFTAMSYPLLISSVGIIVCLLTTLFATDLFEIKAVKDIEPTLKRQLVISTLLMTLSIALLSWAALPSSFTIFNFGQQKLVKNWHLFSCVAVGLWAGLIIGFVTEYYTSNAYSPVQDVADSCRTGAATNVIFGLALGYKSVIIPILAIAVSIFVSFSFAAMYGIAVAALGMLSTIATGLAIDAYGPISDNAGGIAEMAGMSHRIRERTDALDAAGNTTAAIGKGFAIGSAALVSLALFGAFVSRAGVGAVDVLSPKVFMGLIVGAMLPYWFSAMTMKSVGSAALKMVEEVRRQFNTIPGLLEGHAKPDYATCVQISTDASIKEMIPPGALVILTPLLVGTLFGVLTLSGVLAGALVSGVQVAISASNTGGAWDNAKKYIEAGASEHARMLGPKGSEPHKAAVIGDTIGDPLKDTSGPSLNILIKLMAVESLVFAPFFATHGGVVIEFRKKMMDPIQKMMRFIVTMDERKRKREEEIKSNTATSSCPDIEDSVPSTMVYEDKKNSLLVRFRKKGFWVTDLTKTEWCEKQMEFSLFRGKPKKTVAMKIGSNRHKKLEEEVVQKMKIRIKTNEDVWALRFLHFIRGVDQLLLEGMTRELPVFGLVEGVWFIGVIDELQLSSTDGRPIIVDTKTRGEPCLPREAQQRNGRMQLMCYKLLWDYLVLNDFPSRQLLSHFDLDPGYVLPKEFANGIMVPLRTLADVIDHFEIRCSVFFSAHKNLVLRYELQKDNSLISEERFDYDERWLKSEVSRILEFWRSERGPSYPTEDERWKCHYCPFASNCIMGVESER